MVKHKHAQEHPSLTPDPIIFWEFQPLGIGLVPQRLLMHNLFINSETFAVFI